MEKQEIPLENYRTIFSTGAKTGDILCGIGYGGAPIVGLMIRIMEEIEPNENDLNFSFIILEPGNLVLKYPDLTTCDTIYQTIDFAPGILDSRRLSRIQDLPSCSKRFGVGQKVKIVEQSGNNLYKLDEVVTILKIKKFPDDRETESAYYEIGTDDRSPGKKLDKGLAPID
ncbi:MAG: hypothetical protein IPN29_13955 [Saprospiraceae bacterium]|nr:hypothetical protein [Saprospiraceae bacterium]